MQRQSFRAVAVRRGPGEYAQRVSARRQYILQRQRGYPMRIPRPFGGAGGSMLLAKKRGVNSPELKEKLLVYNSVNITIATATWYGGSVVSDLQQGTTASTRLGDRIEVRSLNFNMAMGSAAAQSYLMRVVIFLDRHANGGGIPALTDVFTSDNIWAMYKTADRAVRGRFNILYDKVFTFSTTTGYQFDKFFYDKPFKMEFLTSTGAIADWAKNSLFIAACAHSMEAGAGSVEFSCKLRFTDL